MPSVLERTAHQLLSERLRTIGFEPIERLSFCRDADGCKQLINIPTRREGGKLKFTCILGVRFEEIETLLARTRLRPDTNKKSYPTAICPIHLLPPEREYYEWEGGNERELATAIDSMIVEIYHVGLEFFDKFNKIEAIEKELSSSSVSDYLTLAPPQRTSTLAAIALVHGDRTTAENLFAAALNDPRNQRPGDQRLLQELRTQLLVK